MQSIRGIDRGVRSTSLSAELTNAHAHRQKEAYDDGGDAGHFELCVRKVDIANLLSRIKEGESAQQIRKLKEVVKRRNLSGRGRGLFQLS